MREILFRGKSVDTGEWLYGDLTHIGNSDRAQIWVLNEDGGRENYLVYADTVGQCTGLIDRKTGKVIFEGDIIRLEDYHGERLVEVFWGGSMGCWMYGGDGFSDEYIFNADHKRIVGNIYDNPELLEAK